MCSVPLTMPGGNPVTAEPGETPRSPLMTEAPVLVTVLPASTPKLLAVPSPTGATAAPAAACMAMITAMTMTRTDSAPTPVYASGLRAARMPNSAMPDPSRTFGNYIAEPSHHWRQQTQEFLSKSHGISWDFLPDSLETCTRLRPRVIYSRHPVRARPASRLTPDFQIIISAPDFKIISHSEHVKFILRVTLTAST